MYICKHLNCGHNLAQKRNQRKKLCNHDDDQRFGSFTYIHTHTYICASLEEPIQFKFLRLNQFSFRYFQMEMSININRWWVIVTTNATIEWENITECHLIWSQSTYYAHKKLLLSLPLPLMCPFPIYAKQIRGSLEFSTNVFFARLFSEVFAIDPARVTVFVRAFAVPPLLLLLQDCARL